MNCMNSMSLGALSIFPLALWLLRKPRNESLFRGLQRPNNHCLPAKENSRGILRCHATRNRGLPLRHSWQCHGSFHRRHGLNWIPMAPYSAVADQRVREESLEVTMEDGQEHTPDHWESQTVGCWTLRNGLLLAGGRDVHVAVRFSEPYQILPNY